MENTTAFEECFANLPSLVLETSIDGKPTRNEIEVTNRNFNIMLAINNDPSTPATKITRVGSFILPWDNAKTFNTCLDKVSPKYKETLMARNFNLYFYSKICRGCTLLECIFRDDDNVSYTFTCTSIEVDNFKF